MYSIQVKTIDTTQPHSIFLSSMSSTFKLKIFSKYLQINISGGCNPQNLDFTGEIKNSKNILIFKLVALDLLKKKKKNSKKLYMNYVFW